MVPVNLLICRLAAMFLLFSGCLAAAENSARPSAAISGNMPPPQLAVTSWALMEQDSGWLVAGFNQNQALPPASITKLMTNYVIFDLLKAKQIDFDDEVSISEAAWRAEGSRMFANLNSKVNLKHLLKSTIIQSGNDAAIALAEHAGGSEMAFAQLMNQSAARLGLSNSYFENSTGLPAPQHRMSARDIALLSRAIIRDYPEYFTWYSEKEYTHNDITQYNRNKLLWKEDSVDGFKTGHTEAAGYCLVGTAQRNGRRWIAVVLGAENAQARERAVLDLLNFGFAAFKSIPILDQQGGVTAVPVYRGEADTVRLQTSSASHVVVHNGREADIEIEYQLSPYYEAPIKLGQAMGLAQIILDGTVIADVPLVAMSEIGQGNWWKRLSDTIKLRAHQFWFE